MLGQAKPLWQVFPPIQAREECSICRGTGWELMTSGGPATARRCPCVALTRTVRLKDRIQIPERYRHCTLESFHPRTLAQTRGLAEAWRFVERFPDGDRGMVFAGEPGAGKTHLAVGILLELAQRFHEDILFVDFRSLPGLHWSPGGLAVHSSSAPAKLKAVSLLVLDAFGEGAATEEQYQAALHVLHGRMRGRKPTLCTTTVLSGFDATETSKASWYVRHQAHALLLGCFKIVNLSMEDRASDSASSFSLS